MKRLGLFAIACLFAMPAVVAACSDDSTGEEAFDTLQDCYDDHVGGAEHLSITEAVSVCCLDHPIAGVNPSCGADSAACQTHVKAEIPALTDPEIKAACDEYATQLTK